MQSLVNEIASFSSNSCKNPKGVDHLCSYHVITSTACVSVIEQTEKCYLFVIYTVSLSFKFSS